MRWVNYQPASVRLISIINGSSCGAGVGVDVAVVEGKLILDVLCQ
jgi:hypothetical protein